MVTLSKIAKLANVSLSTASKAFSGSSEVHEETRNRIFEIAKQQGCFKKFYNAKYPKLVLAVILPEFSSVYYTRYLSALRASLDETVWELSVSTTNFRQETEKELLDYYYKHANADGIIVIGARTVLQEQYEVPVVFVEPTVPQSYGITVCCDIFLALRQALEYLKAGNVETVGFLGETLTGKKQRKCLEYAEELGLQMDSSWVQVTKTRFAPGGYEAMEKLLAAKVRPRAVICAYDYMAMGAIRCLADRGLRVPEDVAILGFDDIPEASYYNPPLASVSNSTQQVCALAAIALEKQLAGETIEPHQEVASQFCLRASFAIGGYL